MHSFLHSFPKAGASHSSCRRGTRGRGRSTTTWHCISNQTAQAKSSKSFEANREVQRIRDMLAGYNTQHVLGSLLLKISGSNLGLAWLIKRYQTFRKILAAQLHWAVRLKTTIWTPFLTLFSNRLWKFVSSLIVSDFRTEEQLIWIHAIHAEL